MSDPIVAIHRYTNAMFAIRVTTARVCNNHFHRKEKKTQIRRVKKMIYFHRNRFVENALKCSLGRITSPLQVLWEGK